MKLNDVPSGERQKSEMSPIQRMFLTIIDGVKKFVNDMTEENERAIMLHDSLENLRSDGTNISQDSIEKIKFYLSEDPCNSETIRECLQSYVRKVSIEVLYSPEVNDIFVKKCLAFSLKNTLVSEEQCEQIENLFKDLHLGHPFLYIENNLLDKMGVSLFGDKYIPRSGRRINNNM